jgi:hypothetical protein
VPRSSRNVPQFLEAHRDAVEAAVLDDFLDVLVAHPAHEEQMVETRAKFHDAFVVVGEVGNLLGFDVGALK